METRLQRRPMKKRTSFLYHISISPLVHFLQLVLVYPEGVICRLQFVGRRSHIGGCRWQVEVCRSQVRTSLKCQEYAVKNVKKLRMWEAITIVA